MTYQKSKPIVCLLSVVLNGVLVPLMVSDLSAEDLAKFVDDDFKEFSQGTFDDGGHNFYAAHDGTLRTINRFDLNGDGHLDVIFNCTHNTYQMLPATSGTIGGERLATSVDIAVEGSQQVSYGDLNRDGFTDLVFCPNPIGVHHDRRFVIDRLGRSRRLDAAKDQLATSDERRGGGGDRRSERRRVARHCGAGWSALDARSTRRAHHPCLLGKLHRLFGR